MKNVHTIYSPDKRWRAEISARHGANVTKLQYDGNDVFVPLESEEQLEKNPYIQGTPILLPANRTFKGKFEFEGKTYTLPINEPLNNAHLHGLLHKQSFDLLEITSNEICLCYENTGQIYPFPFKMKVTYSLKSNIFEQKYYIKNTGKLKMPITFALHTSFVEPEMFSVPINSCQEKDEHHIPTGRYVLLNPQESKYSTGSASKGIAISGYYKSCGNTAKVGNFVYKVSDNFDHWVLFNGKGESNLLCVEPQCGAVNGLNMDNGNKVINSGDTLYFSTELSDCKALLFVD